MLSDREMAKIMKKIVKMSKADSKVFKTKKIVCSVDLGIVILEISMGLN